MRFLCRYKLCRLQFVFLWIILGFFVMIVTFFDPFFDGFSKKTLISPHQKVKDNSDLDEIIDSRDQMELGGFSSLSLLKEDQLIIVPSKVKRKQNPQKKANYKMLRSGGKKDARLLVSTHSHLGKPVHLILNQFEKDIEESGLKKHGFNELASKRISLHRRLPEVRHPSCLTQQYSVQLPTASVIICFHNEAWSTLLRTVHSVLDTVPKTLLKDVILVDDLSRQGHLKSSLSEHIAKLDGVKLIRSNKRLGVTGGRMLGAARASGDVLVFMDSHCECHKGWLEPLLDRIAGDRNLVVSPVMDIIDWKTFQYYPSADLQRGVFDWKLDFHWEPLPRNMLKKQKSPVHPVRSPALAGGVLAIERNFFQRIGAYDPGMALQGAENVELSIRVWMCGGSMEILPCSRIGHLDRSHIPFSLSDEHAVESNKIRVAETWMDSYKKIFYNRDVVAYFIKKAENFNCTERLQLRKRLGCKNFHSFLSDVHPELYLPQDRPGYSGELYNVGTGYCADYKNTLGAIGKPVMISPCSGNGKQHCEYNTQREVRCGSAGQLCFDVRKEQVILSDCSLKEDIHSRQLWNIIEHSGEIVHVLSEKCIEAVEDEDVKGLFLRPCIRAPRQQWHFEQLIVLNK
ncbi:polypeptide N-acetylgalactosaminyltransferase 15 [Lepisosteus oculatus]|uniref:polypeptide N-acetylgalactosaminyltransferase 15 n=1 Tax=Lepisosteus oculatus TaxID=7918 RepID=UPI0035F5167F